MQLFSSNKKKSHSADAGEIFGMISSQSVGEMIRRQKTEVNTYTVFFDEPIGEPSLYRDLIHELYNAAEHDQFVFLVNSPGGNISATMSIIEAMKQSAAEITCVLVGECHSAASILMLNCEQVFVTESAWSLIHTASYGVEGNSHQMLTQVDFYTKQIRQLLQTTYDGFLTKEEFEDVNKGVEIMFDAKEITRRLNLRNELRAAKAAEPVVEEPTKRSRKAKKVEAEAE